MNKSRAISVLGTCILLNGCLVGSSDSNTEEQSPPIESPEVESLYQLAQGYPIGTALPAGDASNSLFNRDDLQQITIKHFNHITAENIMKPRSLQPVEGTFEYDDADALIAFAETNGMSVHGHTLVWHRQIPTWMEVCADATACEDIMTDHITAVASHFAGKVVSWDVVNEAYDDTGALRTTGDSGSVWGDKIGASYIQTAFETAYAADSAADLYYNDYNLELNGDKLTSVMSMINSLQTASAPIDGIGFQMHIMDNSPDIATIKAALQKVVDAGLKVKITELDVRMNSNGSLTSFTQEVANNQKARYEAVVKAYLETVPAAQRGGISVWGVSDADSWIPGEFGHADWPLLFDDSLNAKPALQGFAAALSSEGGDNGGDNGGDSDETVLFLDDFTDGVYWYEDGSTDVTGTFAHDASDGAMNVDISWSADSNTYSIARAFGSSGETVDFTSANNISFKVKVPADYTTDGNLAIQPFIMDGTYTPAYIGYQFGLQADTWATITISNVDENFSFGYNGNPDFSAIDRIGLQFIANGKPASVTGTIQIDDVKITAAE